MASVLRTAARDSVGQVAMGLAVTFVALALIPVLRAGLEGGRPLMITAAASGITVLLMLGLWRAAQRGAISERWGHATLGLAAALLVLRGQLGWWLFGGEQETGFLAVILIAVGVICLSAAWMHALFAATIVGWAVVGWVAGLQRPRVYIIIFLFAAPAIGTVVRRTRVTTLRREEGFRQREAEQKARLAATLHRLEESEEKFRGIFERIHDILYRADLEGTIEMISPSVERYGYRVEELVGGKDARLFADPAERDRLMWMVSRQREIADCEITLRRQNGDAFAAEASLRLLGDAGGQPVGVEAIVHDISERKRAEEERRQQRARLAHVLRLNSMGEMTAAIAHEINQPLAAISNYAAACARNIRSGTGVQQKLLEGLDLIAAQALRAGGTISRLKTFVGKKVAEQHAIDLTELIHEVARLVEPEARQYGVTIRVALPEQVPEVIGDRVQIQQVMVNLVLNGLEALEAGHAPDALAITVTTLNETTVEVAVRDEGHGLPADVEQMFEPFFSTKAEGLGMGLTISRSIVDAHDGRLWATANAGPGTTFHFTLPVATSPAPGDEGEPLVLRHGRPDGTSATGRR